MITDHLGSIRLAYNARGEVLSSNDYLPFGDTLNSSGKGSHRRWIACERDPESNTNEHGARKYDFRLGRFRSVDKLFENYRDWNGYQYAACNPINNYDDAGLAFQALDDESKGALLNMLTTEAQAYVSFDEDGFINFDIMNSSGADEISDCNFQDLRTIVNSTQLMTLSVKDTISYSDENGDFHDEVFRSVKLYPNWVEGPYTLSTKEVGFEGVTQVPGNSDFYNSRDEAVNVVLNPSLSCEGLAETASHEILGHGLFYFIGAHDVHDFGEGSTDNNKMLIQQIIRSKEETIENIRKKNK
jgi:RHS repeat-associated protein